MDFIDGKISQCGQFDIPTGRYSDWTIFQQIDIATGSLFRHVYIPHGSGF